MTEEFRSDLDMTEKLDARDAAGAEIALSDWLDSGEWNANRRLIAQHLERMAPEEREKYETGTLENGTRLLNDPETLRALAAEARQSPEFLVKAAELGYDGNEFAALVDIMRDRSGPYWKGEHADVLQGRYRDLARVAEGVEQSCEAKPDYRERFLEECRKRINEPDFFKQGVAWLVEQLVEQQGYSKEEKAHAIADYVRRRVNV